MVGELGGGRAWVPQAHKGMGPCFPFRGPREDVQGQRAKSCFAAGKVLVLPELSLPLTCFL